MRNKLPDICYYVPKTTGKLSIIKKYYSGYFPCRNCNIALGSAQEIADFYNKKLALSPAQVEAMYCGSLFGWNTIIAHPQWHFDNAIFVSKKHISGYLEGLRLKKSIPIQGYLYSYKVANRESFFISPDIIPSIDPDPLAVFNCSLIPDLVNGKPLLPVRAAQVQNNTYSLYLEDGCTHSTVYYEELKICSLITVGETQFLLAENPRDTLLYPFVILKKSTSCETITSSESNFKKQCYQTIQAAFADYIAQITDKYHLQKNNYIR